jgi:hypothetical protein
MDTSSRRVAVAFHGCRSAVTANLPPADDCPSSNSIISAPGVRAVACVGDPSVGRRRRAWDRTAPPPVRDGVRLRRAEAAAQGPGVARSCAPSRTRPPPPPCWPAPRRAPVNGRRPPHEQHPRSANVWGDLLGGVLALAGRARVGSCAGAACRSRGDRIRQGQHGRRPSARNREGRSEVPGSGNAPAHGARATRVGWRVGVRVRGGGR